MSFLIDSIIKAIRIGADPYAIIRNPKRSRDEHKYAEPRIGKRQTVPLSLNQTSGHSVEPLVYKSRGRNSLSRRTKRFVKRIKRSRRASKRYRRRSFRGRRRYGRRGRALISRYVRTRGGQRIVSDPSLPTQIFKSQNQYRLFNTTTTGEIWFYDMKTNASSIMAGACQFPIYSDLTSISDALRFPGLIDNATSANIIDSNTSQYVPFRVKKWTRKFIFKNNASMKSYMTIYECKLRHTNQAGATSFSSPVEAAFSNSGVESFENVTATLTNSQGFLSRSLNDSLKFRTDYRIVKTTSYCLQPGDEVNYSMYMKNRIFNMPWYNSQGITQDQDCRFLVFKMHGTLCCKQNDQQNTSTMTLAPFDIGFVFHDVTYAQRLQEHLPGYLMGAGPNWPASNTVPALFDKDASALLETSYSFA